MLDGQEPGSEDQVSEETSNTNDAEKAKDQESKAYDEEYVRKLRGEAAENRKKAKDAETRLKAIEDAQLSESEKLKKENEEAKTRLARIETELRQERSRTAISRAAADAGIPLDLAEKLIEVEYSEDGQITTDLKKSMTDLGKKYPQLIASSNGSGSPTNPSRSGQGEQRESDDQRRRTLYGGSGVSIFDPEVAKRLGGGVSFDPEVNPKQR